MDRPLYEALGHWAYFAALSPYYGILIGFVWRYRIIMRYEKWWFFFLTALLLFGVLGLLFEWIAGVLHVWIFPLETHTFQMRIPIFGWFGYLVTATVFQALMFFFMTRLRAVVVRNDALVPFSCLRRLNPR